MAETQVHCERRGAAGFVVLDRPKALNALTLDMVRAIAAALDRWQDEDKVRRVVLCAAGGRAFCAGGDIRRVHELGLRGEHEEQLRFWREEYILNCRIKTYAKPIVAVVDGIIMGGGAGLAIHASHRIAGPNTLFAMPEVGIGFFPDVGATYFLPRLRGLLGTFLALTGARIGPGDAMAGGLFTNYCGGGRFQALAEALTGSDDTETVLAEFAAPPYQPMEFARTDWIDRCFAVPDLGEILRQLDEVAAGGEAGAGKAAAAIRRNSPTSLAITLRQMRIGADLDIAEALKTEFRIVSRICRGHDLYEGVRAAVIERDRPPQWQPDRIEDIDAGEIEAHFAGPTQAEDLEFPVTA